MKKPSIKLIAVGAFTALMVSCIGCATPSQMYWDHKVKELCEKDGGVTVYEKVEILKKDYPNLKLTTSGAVILPSADHAKSDDPFFTKSNTIVLHDGSPEVFKFEQLIIRAKDNKELSRHVSYGRRGGDIIPVDNPSYFLCGSDESSLNLLKSVITIKGE